VKKYKIAEMFYSIQGEGVRAGTAAVFLRFAGCNLKCTKATVGWDCDTDHACREELTAAEIVDRHLEIANRCKWVVATGGEPMLQLDAELIVALANRGISVAVETNGTLPVPVMVDWVTVSPKPGSIIRQPDAEEVKIVLSAGDEPPALLPNGKNSYRVMGIRCRYPILSPAWLPDQMDSTAVVWCVAKVREDPRWRLSVQAHKLIGVR